MDLSNLKPACGATKSEGKRLGRGQGSARGGTSGRGHKGQKSVSGYSHKIGFEGGQMPIQRRLPKFGFKNVNRTDYKGVNLQTLEELSQKTGITSIDVQTLVDAGLAPKNKLVKILGQGKLTAKLEVKANAFSKSAIAAIEGLQGTAIIL
jgi:large subunit ribosomal protein L15